jgi:ADP-ribose pyrophosphatase YjhB (NUDIX family)
MAENWLSDEDWLAHRLRIPIACVDVGLIFRETPHQGRRWCLIGGRLRLNEPIKLGISRQLSETLGAKVRFALEAEPHPLFIAEYFSVQQRDKLFDPRQHAIGMIFGVELDGDATPCGEALEFKWYYLDRLPDDREIGFGQERFLAKCIARLKR